MGEGCSIGAYPAPESRLTRVRWKEKFLETVKVGLGSEKHLRMKWQKE